MREDELALIATFSERERLGGIGLDEYRSYLVRQLIHILRKYIKRGGKSG